MMQQSTLRDTPSGGLVHVDRAPLNTKHCHFLWCKYLHCGLKLPIDVSECRAGRDIMFSFQQVQLSHQTAQMD